MDHSAYDAYSFLVEADGKRLFYTGDFRDHGLRGEWFEDLLNNPPKYVDFLITEGTNLGKNQSGVFEAGGLYPTEAALIEPMADEIRRTSGLALIAFSPQNVDRVQSVLEAANTAHRTLVIDILSYQPVKPFLKRLAPMGK
jgi:ribonuclease J